MSGQQPYAARLSPPAAKVLDALPEHAEQRVWDVLDAAAGNSWGFPQWDADDPEGEGRPAPSIAATLLANPARRVLHGVRGDQCPYTGTSQPRPENTHPLV
ncbi:hypothetical protein QFZ66_000334 [Streptomyces sp. B4I13]|nr:hypothetical protein [Streptomyces sp. B4I13]